MDNRHRFGAPVDNPRRRARAAGRLTGMGRRREPLSAELRAISDRMRTCAAERGGVITAARCGSLGADATVVRRLLGAGEWRRVRRGVYRDREFVPGRLRGPGCARHARCADVLAVLGDGAVVSHGTAAGLLGLPLPAAAPAALELTRRPPARGHPIDPGVRIRVADYAAADVLDVHGVPVLGGARLVLDCCSSLSPPDALAVAHAALRRGLVTRDQLAVELERRRGSAGSRVAALVVRRAGPQAEPRLESVARRWPAAADPTAPGRGQR